MDSDQTDRDQPRDDARPASRGRSGPAASTEQNPPGEGGARGSRFGTGGGAPRGGAGNRRPGGYRGRGRREPIFLPDDVIDYKDVQRLRRCLDERGKIVNRRRTGCNAHQQRELTVAIKRARHMALLPFVANGRR